MSERASERMSAAERASEASSAEQANEIALRANQRADEQMAQYSTRRFHSHSTHGAFACSTLLASLARSTALILLLARPLTCSQAHVYELCTRLTARLLACTTHSLDCSALLASLAHFAALTRLLAHFTALTHSLAHSRAPGTVEYFCHSFAHSLAHTIRSFFRLPAHSLASELIA